MTAYTLIANTNVSSLTGRAGGDTIATNGFDLTMDEHSRYGVNASDTTIWAAITLSTTLGGDLKIEGRYTRMVYFTGGSGNVPAYETVISQGGASALLAGVYDSLGVAPTTPGSAMPTNGYILLKQWNSVAYSSGALTGIGANVDSDPVTGVAADRVGWLEIVGQEGSIFTSNGLSYSDGTTKAVKGQPFLIGTTPATPARTDTYQIPTNGNTCYMPGAFVENTPGVGDWEFWPTTSHEALVTKLETDDYRGRYCWIATDGTLRFGNDGTNSTGGALPNANCRIVTGNVFLTMATSASRNVNSLNTTHNTRYRVTTGGLANFEMEWATCNWRINTSLSKKTSASNCGVMQPVTITQHGEPIVWQDCGIGSPLLESSICFDYLTSTAGATFDNVTFGKGGFPTTNQAIFRNNACDNVTWDNCRFTFTGDKVSVSNYGISLISSSYIDIGNCVVGSNINASTGIEYRVHDTAMYFSAYGLPSLTANILSAVYMLNISNYVVEDITFPLPLQLPNTALVTCSANALNGVFRNIGSLASPIDGEIYSEIGASFTRVGTVFTVAIADPAHKMRVGDSIVVSMSDAPTGATLATRVITSISTTQLTFTGVNSGALSGVLSFYCGVCASVLSINGNNVTNTKFQNIHLKANTSYPWVINPTSDTVGLDNISSDYRYVSHPSIAGTNVRNRSIGITTTVTPLTAGVLGTHFESAFVCPTTTTGQVAVSWTRSSGTYTFSVTDHGFTTGDQIQLYNSSNTAGLPNVVETITAVNKDVFTVAGANSGAASGTCSYHVSNSRLYIIMNGPSVETAANVTVDSGTPKFIGSGSLAAFTLGDGLTWESLDWEYGFDNFARVLTTMTASTGIIQHFNCYYALDRGSGFSAFKNLYYQCSGASGVAAANTVTVTDVTGVELNDYVYGTGIAEDAYVTNIDTGTNTLTLSQNNDATVSGTLVFVATPNETTFPSTGIKLKIKIYAFGTPTTSLNGIIIPMVSTNTTRARLYPQDVDTVSFTISGLPTGTTVALYDNTDTELQREDNILTGSFVYDYIHSGSDITDVYYVIWHEDYVPYKSDLFDLTATDLGLSYTPVDDPIYDPAHDDRYTVDFANELIIMDTGETQYDVPGAYSHWKDQIFLADNFTYQFAFTIKGGVDYATPKAIPPFTALINGWKIRPDEANHTLTVENGILYVEGGGDPFVDTLGAYTVRINYSQPVEVLLVSTGSGVLPTDITDIAEAVWQNTDTNTGTQKGKLLKDAAADSEFSAYAK
jgi:hypothetical protein